jgi:hypothetical protein
MSTTIDGLTCTSAVITIPAWGVWWADVETAGDGTVAGPVTIQAPGQAFVGTVVSGGVQTLDERPTDGSQEHRYVTIFDYMFAYQETIQ